MAMNMDAPIYWAPQKKLGGGWIVFKSAPDAPPPPDYVGQAQATSAGNLEAARASAAANRPNEYTPYGSRTWTQGIDGNPDRWSSQVTLSPTGQQQFDSQQRINTQLGQVAEGGLGYVKDTLANPFDWSKVPDAPVAGKESFDNAYNSIIDRNQPNVDRDRAAMQTQLANQGVMRGSEAFTNAERDQAMKENDFRLGAQTAAGAEQSRQFGLDTAAHSQGIQDQSFARNEPLNMLNAVRTGSQIGMPTFQGYGQQGQTGGANMTAAGQAQGQYNQGIYNNEVAMTNQGNATTGQLSAATIAGLAAMDMF